MAKVFSTKTFKYFELAKKNKNKRIWFEKNEDLYLETVREPMAHILREINSQLGSELPRVVINEKKIARPLRRANKAAENGLIKTETNFFLGEKNTSRFEWNPGIYLQLGADKDDNFLGLGVYMASSRQLNLLRNNVVEDFYEIDSLLSEPRLKKTWGKLGGDDYKRFPRGFDEESQAAPYLWKRQFYLGKEFSRKDVAAKDFSKKIIRDIEIALPFFKWIRKTVGVYRRPGSSWS